jgi:hypothetical protein
VIFFYFQVPHQVEFLAMLMKSRSHGSQTRQGGRVSLSLRP